MVLLNVMQTGLSKILCLRGKREKKSYSETSNLPEVCCTGKEATVGFFFFKSLHEYGFCLADLQNPSWTTYLTFYGVVNSNSIKCPVTWENNLKQIT